ncbi:amidohydrolase [Gudongella sp. SC589]|jgi:5-methylthioadenosine/S-adenosylhomocysteine deaminase|uniref:amidohydrolase n=1 Tax=Gudongella sp. SC589 TaxID=3385990 RepID=UPI003904D2B6
MVLRIKNVDIVTVDEKNRILNNSNIYIENGIIIHLGDEIPGIEIDETIDGRNKAALPGLVNAHTHMGMSLLRNYADDLPLHQWLTEKIWPVEANLNGEDIYWGSLLSMAEMIQTGTTTFCDMYFFMDEVGKGAAESGLRAMITRGIVEDRNDPDRKLNESRELFNRYHKTSNDRIRVMIAPHAPYTCSPEFLVKAKNLADDLGTGINIHLSETKREVQESYEIYGKSPIRHVYDLGVLDVHTLAAHCVHVDQDDIELMVEKEVHPVNNPGSNFKLASGFAPVQSMLEKGLNVSLGTDGASSNNNLNMFKELNLAALVNKAVDQDALSIKAVDALRMATINGARGLQWDKEIGSLEVGKRADIILVDLDKPHLVPRHNLVSALAYSTYGSDVDTVIVDGRVLMHKREMKTIDLERIKYMAQNRAMDLIIR